MAHYLIDYENVKNINGLDTLLAEDTIVIFYSNQANSMTFDLHLALCASAAAKKYFFIQSGGKNALDFQLSTYVGYLISENPDEKITIVSNDKGFSYIMDFWKARGVNTLERRTNITEAKKSSVTATNDKTTSADKDNEAAEANESELLSCLRNAAKKLSLNDEMCNKIESIVNQYKTKTAINNNLMKLIRDSQRVGKITKLIKPFLKGKN